MIAISAIRLAEARCVGVVPRTAISGVVVAATDVVVALGGIGVTAVAGIGVAAVGITAVVAGIGVAAVGITAVAGIGVAAVGITAVAGIGVAAVGITAVAGIGVAAARGICVDAIAAVLGIGVSGGVAHCTRLAKAHRLGAIFEGAIPETTVTAITDIAIAAVVTVITERLPEARRVGGVAGIEVAGIAVVPVVVGGGPAETLLIGAPYSVGTLSSVASPRLGNVRTGRVIYTVGVAPRTGRLLTVVGRARYAPAVDRVATPHLRGNRTRIQSAGHLDIEPHFVFK